MSQAPNEQPAAVDVSRPEAKVTRSNWIDLHPSLIPSEDGNLFLTFNMIVEARLKRGRYGVVYSGRFHHKFSLQKMQSYNWHAIYLEKQVREKGVQGMAARFALKYSDIVTRKAYSIEDIDDKIRTEMNFIRKFDFQAPGSEAIVRFYFMLSTNAWRHYVFMERADDNLQCLLADYGRQGQVLPIVTGLDIFATLVQAIRAMHAQQFTYNMLKLSNILVFYEHQPTCVCLSDNAFKVKITDFVGSVHLEHAVPASRATLVVGDLNDLYQIQYDLLKNCCTPVLGWHEYRESLRKCLISTISTHESVQRLDEAHRITCEYGDKQRQQ